MLLPFSNTKKSKKPNTIKKKNKLTSKVAFNFDLHT